MELAETDAVVGMQDMGAAVLRVLHVKCLQQVNMEWISG